MGIGCPTRWVLGALLLLAACSDGEASGPCASDSDCSTAEVCLSWVCSPRACGDRPCRQGQGCVHGVCIDADCTSVTCPAGQTCAKGSCFPNDCPGQACLTGEVCWRETACRTSACQGVQCPSGETCADGRCLPTACSGAECPTGAACEEGRCQPVRCIGVACPDGKVCADGRCLPRDCPGGCPAGEGCLGGQCVDVACMGVTCPSGTPCVHGRCGMPAPDAGTADAGGPDAGTADAGAPDAGAGADAGMQPDAGGFRVSVAGVTSSTVSLSWSPVAGATSQRVYISYEPSSGALPDQKELAALPAGATSYTMTRIAAAVDVFVRVEATTPTGLVGANAHARTIGGRLAKLDSPLKSIHLMAPDMLLLVMENKGVHSYTDNLNEQHCNYLAPDYPNCDAKDMRVLYNTGPTWQAGPWTIKRNNGATIGVTNVYRNSIPARQTKNDWYHDHYVDVDHYIYLKLAQPIGEHELLTISGPSQFEVLLPYSDRYLETPVLQVNQVAYSPRASKRYAYVSGWMGDGGPLSLANFPTSAEVLREEKDPMTRRGASLLTRPVVSRSAFDSDAGAEVKQIDLSGPALASEDAVYRVRLPGVGVSWQTRVSERDLFQAFYVTARGLYHNRWGRDLQPQWTDWSPRPPDHPFIYTSEAEFWDPTKTENIRPEPPLTGRRPMNGGHHDAGDCDIRIFHTANAMHLLRLYELNAAAFSNDQLTIPESGNGIPDLLDEALYSVKAWEQLQESDGGVRAGVNEFGYCVGYTDEDTHNYFTYARDLRHTLRVTALFAVASRLVAPFDQARAAGLAQRALDAYGYVAARATPADRARGEWLWMAGELWRLTGDPAYKAQYEATWKGLGASPYLDVNNLNLYPGSAETNNAIGEFVIAYSLGSGANTAYVNQAKSTLTSQADEVVARFDSVHAHRNPRGATQNPDWGWGTTMTYSMHPIFWRMQLGGLTAADSQRYFDALSLAADYELGCNPLGMVWVTGLGTRSPVNALHVDSLAFDYRDGKGPIPGIPVYGPVKERPGWYYYDYGERVFFPAFASHPLMRRYADLFTFVNTNEFDIVVQVSHTMLYGALVKNGMVPRSEWLPAAAR